MPRCPHQNIGQEAGDEHGAGEGGPEEFHAEEGGGDGGVAGGGEDGHEANGGDERHRKSEQGGQCCPQERADHEEGGDLAPLEAESQSEGGEEELQREGPGGDRAGALEDFREPLRAQVQIGRGS